MGSHVYESLTCAIVEVKFMKNTDSLTESEPNRNIGMKDMERYNFLSDDEPTDEQLSEVMREVAEGVRKRAEETRKKLQEEIRQRTKDTIARWSADRKEVS